MKVLIIGSGGREHALAWKTAQSNNVEQILVAPGNGGTATLPKTRNVAIDADNIEGLLKLAQQESIALTIVGPEAPLVAGIVDRFNEAGLACFGPSALAAQLEGSKAFAKDFMARHNIPTAEYGNFTELEPALTYLESQTFPIVIKASGLAAGKGVIIASTHSEAEQAVRDMLQDQQFGSAGQEVVIEQFLTGEEASFIVIAAGTDYIAFPSSQDHKRAYDGDLGPNTGGMGAYSPAPVVNPAIQSLIESEVIKPTLQGLVTDGTPFTGFLYAGVMINDEGRLHVLEYNCRMGDPETQPLMMRLNSDLTTLLQAAIDNQLGSVSAAWDTRAALGVVLAADGYPGSYAKGSLIKQLPELTDDLLVFHAGTKINDEQQLVTSGGRVLCITALGNDFNEARKRAYEAINQVDAEACFYRKDIGHRAMQHYSAKQT